MYALGRKVRALQGGLGACARGNIVKFRVSEMPFLVFSSGHAVVSCLFDPHLVLSERYSVHGKKKG